MQNHEILPPNSTGKVNQKMNHINDNYKQAATLIQEEHVIYRDVRKPPFQIYGLYQPETEKQFKRLPDEVGQNTNARVSFLYAHTAGGRIRFTTNSRYIALKAQVGYNSQISTMPLQATAGFDVYTQVNGRETYAGTIRPPVDFQDHYEAAFYFPDARERAITLYMPLYNELYELEIGLDADASVSEGAPYAYPEKILYYGSSITQGQGASRPGMAYPSIISRKLNRDFVNLGFAGACKAEKIMVDYLAGQEYDLFVCDYDYNSPSADYLRETHYPLYQAVRSAHPQVPILFLTAPRVPLDQEWFHDRRQVIFETYMKARAQGDRKVYFADGHSFMEGEGREECLVDGLHPSDMGYYRMANMIGKVLESILNHENEIAP